MLNWLLRYVPVVDALELGGPLGSVLDVGCGPHGLSCVRPDVRFVGVDVELGERVAPTMLAVRSPPGPLPFPDAAFDTVLCLDVLEHVPAADRAAFVAELGRVTAGRLAVACPTTDGQALDDALLAAAGDPAPTWLAEHFEHGLPTPAEVDALTRLPGFERRAVAMPGAHLSALVVHGDLDPTSAAAQEYAARAPHWRELIRAACFGPSLRAGWLLTRAPADVAVVRADRLAATTRAVLRSGASLLHGEPED